MHCLLISGPIGQYCFQTNFCRWHHVQRVCKKTGLWIVALRSWLDGRQSDLNGREMLLRLQYRFVSVQHFDETLRFNDEVVNRRTVRCHWPFSSTLALAVIATCSLMLGQRSLITKSLYFIGLNLFLWIPLRSQVWDVSFVYHLIDYSLDFASALADLNLGLLEFKMSGWSELFLFSADLSNFWWWWQLDDIQPLTIDSQVNLVRLDHPSLFLWQILALMLSCVVFNLLCWVINNSPNLRVLQSLSRNAVAFSIRRLCSHNEFLFRTSFEVSYSPDVLKIEIFFLVMFYIESEHRFLGD
jgi:hypothetical protein